MSAIHLCPCLVAKEVRGSGNQCRYVVTKCQVSSEIVLQDLPLK